MLSKERKHWIEFDYEIDPDSICGISWKNDHGCRTLIYNMNVPIVKNNIDMCLFDGMKYFDSKKNEKYIALGELKGGVDPAGADEHWKTARTALDRIRKSFVEFNIKTFFVGFAIEKRMSDEIWSQLLDGTLSYAANLSNDEKVTYLCEWLVNS